METNVRLIRVTADQEVVGVTPHLNGSFASNLGVSVLSDPDKLANVNSQESIHQFLTSL